jgi:AcrR family transcriptional regulator
MNSKIYRKKSIDKAEQILKGAFPEFLEHGYANTSMDRIASVSGVSKQTLYTHFADKNGLFTALVQHMACEKFQMVWSKPLKGEPREVLKELALRMIGVISDRDYLSFLRLILAESGNRPDLAQCFLKNVSQPSMNILSKYFEDRPELNLDDPEAAARVFVGAVISFIMTQEMLHGREIMPMEESRLIDCLLNLILPQD